MASVDPLTGVRAARFGLYLHFPYCLSRCPYCDFAVTISRQPPEERYTKAILRELQLRRETMQPRALDTIFFGGGTPSLWSPKFVGQVVDAVAAAFPLASGAEISMEANPEAMDLERWRGLRSAGVNRLSLGVQSFDAEILKSLGRHHDGPMAVRAFEHARQAGFENLSLDLIFGVQGQTVEQVRGDARQAAALGGEHVSAYGLTLDVESLAFETKLAKQLKRGEVKLPPEEAVVEMGQVLREELQAGGFQRYEVSNFARAGFESTHNALYWTGGEYLALGAGAVGMLRSSETIGERFFNERGTERYLKAVEEGRLPEADRESLDREELFAERAAMGLRLVNGIDLPRLCESSGQSWAAREKKVEQLVKNGLASWKQGRVALTQKGLDLHSAISAQLI